MSYGMFGPVDPDLVSVQTAKERYAEEEDEDYLPEWMERTDDA